MTTSRKEYLRNYSHKRQTAFRVGERDIGSIPPIKNERRRRMCGKDPALYCRTYFPHLFTNPFVPDQLVIIGTIVTGMQQRGWLADAAERGGGKTTITNGLISWGINYGLLKFLLLLKANKDFAKDAMAELQAMYERSEILAEDFPEICYPVARLEGAPQRAKMQSYLGERTHIVWSNSMLRMPMIKGSKSAGSIIQAKGIDAAIRGMGREGVRPDFTLVDDIETRESVNSVVETSRRRETLERDVVGLAGSGKKMSIVMLGTILKKDCLIDEFTDQKRKPAWHGLRQKMLKKKPDDEEAWEKYMEMRRAGQIEGDKTGKKAHKFYLKNRKAMDAGAVISNPYRFDKDFESSALEACYNLIADMEYVNFACEYQNDPPETSDSDGVDIDVATVCKKLNRLERGVVPGWCDKLTCGIDIGGRLLHWTVTAWKQGLEGCIVDYGTEQVNSPFVGSLASEENKQAVEKAILTALNDFWAWEKEGGWPNAETGEIKHIDLGLVDSNWMCDPVCIFRDQTRGVYRASKGFGSGSRQSRYTAPRKKGKLIGHHWHATKVPKSGWIFGLDADYWKNAVHNGFLTPDNMPGSLSLFGGEPVRHRAFARQITAEKWVREFVAGKGWKEGFVVNYRQNHWLDSTSLAMAAASMLNIRLMGKEKTTQKQPQRKWH